MAEDSDVLLTYDFSDYVKTPACDFEQFPQVGSVYACSIPYPYVFSVAIKLTTITTWQRESNDVGDTPGPHPRSSFVVVWTRVVETVIDCKNCYENFFVCCTGTIRQLSLCNCARNIFRFPVLIVNGINRTHFISVIERNH